MADFTVNEWNNAAAAEKKRIDEYLERTREIARLRRQFAADAAAMNSDVRRASQYQPATEDPEDEEPEFHDAVDTMIIKAFGVGTPQSDDGYDSLRGIYAMALEQAQGGKGKERHANGQPFDQQPICQGGRRFGPGCLIYQAWKKAHETPVLLTMDNGKERAIRELLGVMNYAAAAIIVLQEGGNAVE
jgi:hypothetical protein